ncbi:hypothetical protein C8R45DRAFT_834407, partial [Mycena sanguinolenta]
CSATYTVVAGDTCSAIEASTGVSDAQLHALNPAINSGCTSKFLVPLICRYVLNVFARSDSVSTPDLSVGQILCLNGSVGGCTSTYTVQSGDTCSAIEAAKGISDTQLHTLNPSTNSGCTSMFSISSYMPYDMCFRQI